MVPRSAVWVTIPFKDVIYDVIALFPGIINIEVGRRSPFRINESLEVKVQVNRINISDFQAVSNN
jgi:hypothetical protein